MSSAPPRWGLVGILLEGVGGDADGNGYGGDVEVAGVGIERDDFHANRGGPSGSGPSGGPALEDGRGKHFEKNEPDAGDFVGEDEAIQPGFDTAEDGERGAAFRIDRHANAVAHEAGGAVIDGFVDDEAKADVVFAGDDAVFDDAALQSQKPSGQNWLVLLLLIPKSFLKI